jgi:hypothetical protein
MGPAGRLYPASGDSGASDSVDVNKLSARAGQQVLSFASDEPICT